MCCREYLNIWEILFEKLHSNWLILVYLGQDNKVLEFQYLRNIGSYLIQAGENPLLSFGQYPESLNDRWMIIPMGDKTRLYEQIEYFGIPMHLDFHPTPVASEQKDLKEIQI